MVKKTGSRWLAAGLGAIFGAGLLVAGAQPSEAARRRVVVREYVPSYRYVSPYYDYGYSAPYGYDRYSYRSSPYAYGYGPSYSYRYLPRRSDRDWDGIPNRWDRDRDGDGVRNRRDRRPNNPYRR